jgi:ubiquinone/menaquinone biosynthesis C-methylase UbiE
MTAVAIVIPTLNRGPLLGRAITSALACRPTPDEVVVVDCGSTDDTAEIARSFGDEIVFVRRQLRNAACARNVGLAATSAPYVGFLDSDDEALPGKTGGLAIELDSSRSVSLVHGVTEVVDADDRQVLAETASHAKGRAMARSLGTDYPALASFCSMYTSATLARRDALEAIGGFDESLDIYEDWDLYLRLALVGELSYLDVPAARYRVWPGNVPWDRTAAGVIQVARKHLAGLDAVPARERRAAAFGFQCRIAGSSYTLLELDEARRAAIAALRIDPGRAVAAPEVRRALTRWVIPRRILRDRRAPEDDRHMSETETDWPERIDPLDTVPGVVAHHLKKYEFARSRIDGVVIDVACGVGYGSDYLRSAAKTVVGVDIADEAISIARDRYRSGNVFFVRSDAELLPFPDDSVDVVTCFEGIEHFRDPDAHLDEAVRVLKPEGTYFISTPHPGMHAHGEDNPFHLHEFEPERFEAMLRERFTDVEMLGQRRKQTEAHARAQELDFFGIRRVDFLRPLTKLVSRKVLKTAPTEEATVDDFVIGPFDERASEYVAACSSPKRL